MNLHVKFENFGNVPIEERIVMEILARDIGGMEQLLAMPSKKISLDPGEAKTLKLKIKIPKRLPAGTYTLLATALTSPFGDAVAENDALLTPWFVT